MVANFARLYAANESELIVELDDFLVNHVGWYRIETLADTPDSDRFYVYDSDGEPERAALNDNPRYIAIRGRLDFLDQVSYDTYTVGVGNTGSIQRNIPSVPGPLVCYAVADKERLIYSIEETRDSTQWSAPVYIGWIHSFFDKDQDPYPHATKGTAGVNDEWHENITNSKFYMITNQLSSTEDFLNSVHTTIVDAGGPNPRNGLYFTSPTTLYFTDTFGDYELRGQARGCYQITNKIGHRNYITLASGTHIVLKGTGLNSAWAYGPLVDPRCGDPFSIPPITPEVDYDYRGFVTTTGTLGHWRFDEESGGVYLEETSSYPLTPQNSPSLVKTPLVYGLDVNGSTQYASGSSDAAAVASLLGEWSAEIIFKPDTVDSADEILIDHSANTEDEANNTLIRISHVDTGKIRVYWEKDSGTDVLNDTTSAPVLEDRWNYIAIIKRYNGSNYDIDVWHASFGDHSPNLIETFASVDNATGGSTGGWSVGAVAGGFNHFDGVIDEIRIQEGVLTSDQIHASASRVRL